MARGPPVACAIALVGFPLLAFARFLVFGESRVRDDVILRRALSLGRGRASAHAVRLARLTAPVQ
jgi:hypothetical protein